MSIQQLRVIAFTHKHLDVQVIGQLVVAQESQNQALQQLKKILHAEEIFYLGTCNRVEVVFCSDIEINSYYLGQVIDCLRGTKLEYDQVQELQSAAQSFAGEEALNHLMRVSASLESMVVGEKEILAQLRKSYDQAREEGFTGDFLRLCMNRIVKTAKEIYTNTKISEKPISVVSIAYRKLREMKIDQNSRILLIGAGETNQLFAKYLQKHQLQNFVVFNRTVEKAEQLAAELGGLGLSLNALHSYQGGFDVIITCTSATEPIIDLALYQSLLAQEKDRKVIVDLAIPNDTHQDVLNENVQFISVQTIQETIQKNIEDRHAELCHAENIIHTNMQEFRPILKQRKVELAMQAVPVKIKEIRQTATEQVFANEIEELDPQSKEVLEKVLNYMEKKFISIPMVMAKEILVNE